MGIDVKDERSLTHYLLPQNRKATNIEQYVHKVTSFGKTSEVFLIPTVTSATSLKEIHWDKAEDIFLRDRIIPTFRDVYNLDYLLLDSRTGVSRLSVSPLAQADLGILFCRLDKQNLDSFPKIIKICKSAGVPIITIASSVPSIKNYKTKISSFQKKIEYKIDIILPYKSELYFNEEVVSHKSPTCQLAKAYWKLTNRIIEDITNND